MIENGLKDVTDAIEKIEKKLGFWKFVKYVVLFGVIYGIINYEGVVRRTVSLFNDISSDIHTEKMQLRDQLLSELYPLLVSFRASTNADRILYFEYHNSKENLVGIPFKYIELILQDSKYGVSRVAETKYRDINTGIITTLYERVKHGEVAYSTGPEDEYFNSRFPGVYEFFNGKDNSKGMIFISIPGVTQPLGLIILEWMEPIENEVDVEKVVENARKNYIPRINGAILSKTSRW